MLFTLPFSNFLLFLENSSSSSITICSLQTSTYVQNKINDKQDIVFGGVLLKENLNPNILELGNSYSYSINFSGILIKNIVKSCKISPRTDN